MVSIFTSAKQLRIETKADAQIVLQQFRDRIGDNDFLSRFKNSFSRKAKYIGKVDGREAQIEYCSKTRNSLQPTMHVRVESASGGCVISTSYSTSVFVKVFVLLWIAVALLGSITIVLSGPAVDVTPPRFLVLFFPVWGAIVVVMMRILARRDESKLEAFVRDVVEASEARQYGEKNTNTNKEFLKWHDNLQ